MAHPLPPGVPPKPRVRTARMADHAAELLIVLAMASVTALWLAGAPVASLLIHTPV